MEKQFQISRYLNNEMSPTERAAFKKEMANNHELRKEVELNSDLYQYFATRNPDLEKKLGKLGDKYFVLEKPKNDKKLLWLTIIAILSAMVLYFCFFNKPPQSIKPLPETKQNTSILSPTASIDTLQKQRVLKTPTIEKQQKIEETMPANNPPVRLKSKPKSKQQPNKPSQPIAQLNSADFVENPILESIINENLRSNERFIDITKPAAAIFSASNPVAFTLAGTTNATPPYQLRIYTNQPTDFEEDLTIFSKNLTGQPTNEHFSFSINQKIKLPSGLYYFLLLQKESQELLYGDKFLVK